MTDPEAFTDRETRGRLLDLLQVDLLASGGSPFRPSLRSKRFRFVSEQRKTEEPGTGFSILAPREMKQEPKNESGGRGRGRKETLADKPLDFENLRSPANAAPDWLG